MAIDARPVRPEGQSLMQALDAITARGFAASMNFHAGQGIACGVCATTRPAAQWDLLEMERVEGVSDPADEAVVAGILCRCGARGAIVLSYGPAGAAEEAEAFQQLRDTRATGTATKDA